MTSWFDIFRMGVVSCLGVTYRGKGKVLECITAPVMPCVCFKRGSSLYSRLSQSYSYDSGQSFSKPQTIKIRDCSSIVSSSFSVSKFKL